MTDGQLRTALQVVADEVAVVDLGPRVRARARVVRRRRRVAVAAVPLTAVLVAAAVLAAPTTHDAAPPAGQQGAPVVDLAAAPVGGLTGATLAVVDTETGDTWVLTAAGRAARIATRVQSLPGALPALSAAGTVLSYGAPGTVTLVDTVDGSSRELTTTDPQVHQVSVSPDGGTVAYAADDQVDTIDLTLVPRDGGAPTTLPVTTTAATGALVPTVWSDDGTAVLVLEGGGATLVDLLPEPAARPGVHVPSPAVLANGWAASPDLSRFAMSDQAPRAGTRRWQLIDATGNAPAVELSRPGDDRLMGWTPDDRLVWWHRVPSGYAVVSTDTAGGSARTELRVGSARSTLEATWVEDAG